MKMYIYGLFDVLSVSQEVFYVGLTSNIYQRKLNHVGHKRRSVWKHIKKLRSAGSDFSFKLLEETNDIDGPDLERQWIAKLTPIVNINCLRLDNAPPIPICGLKIQFGGTLENVQNQAINQVLKLCKGNISQAAGVLGIGRQTLYNKLQKR